MFLGRLTAAWPHMSTKPLVGPTDRADYVTYDIPAYNLLAGNGYSQSLASPYEPGVMRAPIYPWVLAAIYATLGRGVILKCSVDKGIAWGASFQFPRALATSSRRLLGREKASHTPGHGTPASLRATASGRSLSAVAGQRTRM